MRRKAIICILATILVTLMILSAIPSTVGDSNTSPRGTRSEVFEIGTDVQRLPPLTSGLFLPFMKHETGSGGGSRGLFLYHSSILLGYGMDSAGTITRLSVLNMWGGQIYNHPTAGPQFSAGSARFLNFRVKMGLTTIPSCVSNFNMNYNAAGPTTVFSYPGWLNIQGTHMNWIDCPLDTPFEYDGVSNLIIEYEWDGIIGSSMGSNHGGTWAGGYAALMGNMLTGFFDGNGYSTMCWSPFTNSVTGAVYGPPSDYLMVLQIEGDFAIPADVRIEPQSLNLESMGNYVNIKVEGFPENAEYTPLDVDATYTEIEGIGCELKYGTWNENRFITKADRLLVEDAIGAPSDDAELEIKGKLQDGTGYKGTCTIKAIVNVP